jgi:hypothetical protein
MKPSRFGLNQISVSAVRASGGWMPQLTLSGTSLDLGRCRKHKNHVFKAEDEALSEGRVCAKFIYEDIPPVVGSYPTKKRKKRKKREEE